MESGDQLELRAEHLTGVASDTSRHVRNVYITFLLLCTYIGIIIGSTTHEQLLRVDPVTLPILNVGLPIVGFYIFIPGLLVIFHFNMLLQFYFLSRVLSRADEAIDRIKQQNSQDELRDTLFPFHFSHLLAGRQHGKGLRFLLTIIVWITVMLIPLLLLVWAQVQFLPYHDEGVTWVQRAALVTDFAILWILWPMSMSPKGSLCSWWRCLVTAPPRILWALIIGLWMGMLTLLRRRPLSQLSAKWKSIRPSCHMRGAMTLLISTLILIPFSLFVAILPDKTMELWLTKLDYMPENWIMVTPEGMTKEEWKRAPMLYFTYALFERKDAPLQRNLKLVGKVLVAGEPSDATLVALLDIDPEKQQQAFQQIRGLENLAGRDLRYANFSFSYLPKVNLKSAQLQGVNLYGAQLQGAKLTSAKLQGAELYIANLQRANLFVAKLQGADLTGAKLQGANLRSAQLQRANLRSAQLQGADLYGAQLQGAKLTTAKLQGADLYIANLQRANLFGAKLQGGILKGTDLSLAVLLKLGRGQFTKENYNTLEKNLIKQNLDEQLMRKILKDVDALIGRADDLVFGSATHHALCDEVDPDGECLTLGQEEQFVKEWVEYIVSLACPDSYIAEGVVRQVMPHQDTRPTYSGEQGMYIYRLQKLQVSMLAKRLLSPDCKGGADIPDEVREKLQKLLHESGLNVSTP